MCMYPPCVCTFTLPLLQVKSALDTSNFDDYPEEEESPPLDDLTGWDKDF